MEARETRPALDDGLNSKAGPAVQRFAWLERERWR